MKTLLKDLLKKLLLLTGVITFTFSAGCSLSDEDFSDIQVIEQIIKNDKEQVFGVELANDEDALADDSLDVVMRKTISFGSVDYYAELIQNSNQGILFGRVVISIEKTRTVNLLNDTLASARVQYMLSGNFKIIRPQWSQAKPFKHELTRYMTFVKTKNPETGESWHRVSVTAAYGTSVNSGLVIDSIRILTAHDSIVANDPFEITMSQRNPLTLKRGDWIWIDIKAHSTINPNDTLVGFVITGQNRNRKEYRNRKPFSYHQPDRYTRFIGVGLDQRFGYNQLMIDFYDRKTLKRIEEPYRSMIISIPYRIIP